jgi:HD-GYP domain-containing protein (c-di-GMP phosphodiesterase class II)
MKTVKTADLREGMVFDAPVYMEGESVFIAAGVPVKATEIERLRKWGVTEVQTEGAVVPGEGSAGIAAKGTRKPWAPAGDRHLVQVYHEAVQILDGVLRDIGSGVPVGHDVVDGLAQSLVERTHQGRNDMVQVVVFADSRKKLAAACVNTAVLSIVIGLQLRLTSHALRQLSLGALLHDVGMLTVPSAIVDKPEKLAEEELAEIRKHPLHSYRLIEKVLRYPQEVAEVGLHHHERWDGKGYPRQLRGEDISLHARIVAVAESYAAMVKERPYRSSMIGYNAMKCLLTDNGRQFDPRVLKAFLTSTGVFPIGSIVQLNNSAIGRIVGVSADAPLRPRVELVVDETGANLEEAVMLDLTERKSLFIVRAIDPRSLETAGPGG